jgi:hypothetical protein
MFFNSAAGEILGMLGFLQLIIYLPLLDVAFAASAKLLYNELTKIVTFDVLPTDALYTKLFSFPEDGGTLSDSFADFDFGQFFIMNMGSLFIFSTITLFQFPIYYCAKCLNCLRVQNYFKDS